MMGVSREDYKVIIFSNLLDSLKVILEAMDLYSIEFGHENNEVRFLLPFKCSSLLTLHPLVLCRARRPGT